MTIKATDADISEWLTEGKLLPSNWRQRLMRPRHKPGHTEGELDVRGTSGREFRIKTRQNQIDVFDFSAILLCRLTSSNKWFILRRYNGRSHFDTNVLENEKPFFDFHIHTATERYQASEHNAEHYAERTTRYTTLTQALDCLVADCGFVVDRDSDTQLDLFE